MSTGSLGRRLVLGAAIWIALALLASGLVLYELFRSHVLATLEASLTADLNQIVAALEIDAAGRPQLTRRPANPLFDKPYSGRYWQINGDTASPVSSRSLWDTTLQLPADALADGALHRHELTGPLGQSLIALERSVRLPERPAPLRLTTAADLAEIDDPLRRFGRVLALSMAALGLGLMGAVVLQVRYGLWPLSRLRAALGDLRAGHRTRLADDWPAEIRPLVHDFDLVLEHNARFLERARTQAGNLAHALKTPLSVLANAAAETDATAAAALADTVEAQVAAMQRHVDHHLARARAAASAEMPGAQANAVETVRQLARTLTKLHAARGITIDVRADGEAIFRGDAEDLMEILGNVLENACKWARQRVTVGFEGSGDRLTITVDDDGPGLPPEQRDAVFKRGARLDESVPGSGFGLGIVRDLVDTYGGSIALDESPFGGLRARLELPGRRVAGAAAR